MEGISRNHELKTSYFAHRALSLLPEMRLLIKGGKLTSKEGWRNVVEHCLVQAVAADVLLDFIGIQGSDKKKVIQVAAIHDWLKRFERKPDEFDDQEKEEMKILAERLEIDKNKNLLDATGPEFLARGLKGEATFLEKIQFYIDDITQGSEIVPFDQRIDEVQKRRQDLHEDKKYFELLGGKFFDKEREFGHAVEKELFDILKGNGVEIEDPSLIPELIKKEIEKRIQSFASNQ